MHFFRNTFFLRAWLLCALSLFALDSVAKAQESVCAKVKIVIEQTLTLERQAFEAKLVVTNGLPSDLTEFKVTVLAWRDDEDKTALPASETGQLDVFEYPENTDDNYPDKVDLFFIKGEGNQRADYVSGTTIPTTEAATFTYILIPTLEAGGELAEGSGYLIGAEITYEVNGVQESLQVEPDLIYVKPLPELRLEYFLPKSVVADNPNTPQVEPVQPFPLGVRVINAGFGDANKLKIESMQPRIEGNEAGLLLDMKIIGSTVNGTAVASPSLLVDFGTLRAASSETANWLMTSSLFGRFLSIDASFSHSDELGGSITSLIPEDGIHTYRLVGVVSGNNDSVPDFLSVGGGVADNDEVRGDFLLDLTSIDDAAFLNLHLSGTTDFYPADLPQVWNFSSNVEVSTSIAPLTVSVTGEPAVPNNDVYEEYTYIRIPDPRRNQYEILSVTRQDGKTLPKRNCWLNAEIAETSDGAIDEGVGFEYYIDLFDAPKAVPNETTYTIVYGGKVTNDAPQITPLEDILIKAGTGIDIAIVASDTDGPVSPVTLSMPQVPLGSFTDNGNNTASYSLPEGSVVVARDYTLVVEASDGVNKSRESFQLSIIDNNDSLLEAWFAKHGLSEADPVADSDGDGLSNLLEYALNLDPNVYSLQGLPVIGYEEVDGKPYLTLTAIVREDSELSYSAQSAPTPDFSSITIIENPTEVSLGNGFKQLKWVDSVELNQGRFMRLHVEYTPSAP